MQTTAQLAAALLPQGAAELSLTLPQSVSGGDSRQPLLLSRLTGKAVIDPNDAAMQFRVVQAFWAKLQRPDVLEPDSPYRPLARQVLEQAAELQWTAEDLEAGCKRFQAAEQFGDRIEIAKFFKQSAETLQPYSWVMEQIHSGNAVFANFDAYDVPGHSKPLWRRHDGRRLEGLTLAVWQGQSVKPVEYPKQPERLLPPEGLKDYAAVSAENLRLKSENAELKRLLAAEKEITAFHQRRIDIKEQVRAMEEKWAKEEAV